MAGRGGGGAIGHGRDAIGGGSGVGHDRGAVGGSRGVGHGRDAVGGGGVVHVAVCVVLDDSDLR